MCKISIIVPVFKVEHYIGRCIESIQKQNLCEWELFLVDDCSPDDSISVIKNYIANDSRIHLLQHSQNRGPMAARQTGYRCAKGEYLMFIDGDDTIPEYALQLLYDTATHTHCDIVSGNIDYFNMKGEVEHRHYKLVYGNKPEDVYKSMLKHEYAHNLCNKLINRRIFVNNDLDCFEHATNGEDGYLVYQLLQYCNSAVHIDKVVYFYWQNSLSTTNNRLTPSGLMSIIKMLLLLKELSYKYQNIKKYFDYFITNALVNKYALGYSNELKLDETLKKYNLDVYVSISFIFKEFSMIDFCVFWAKMFIYPYLRKIKKRFTS